MQWKRSQGRRRSVEVEPRLSRVAVDPNRRSAGCSGSESPNRCSAGSRMFYSVALAANGCSTQWRPKRPRVVVAVPDDIVVVSDDEPAAAASPHPPRRASRIPVVIIVVSDDESAAAAPAETTEAAAPAETTEAAAPAETTVRRKSALRKPVVDNC